jgi:ferredoxin
MDIAREEVIARLRAEAERNWLASLLTRYIAHVMDCEGVSFIGKSGTCRIQFTKEEQEALSAAEKDALKLHDLYDT